MEVRATVPQVDCPSADGAGMPPHSWSQLDAEKFMVRHGPNYSKNKRKGRNAGGSFYEARAMDWYRGTGKVDGVAKLAAAEGLPEAKFSHPSVPSLLVVNVQLPMESPQAFKGAKLDGPTLHAVFYLTLREETAKALQDLESAEPSVRLLAEYFRRAESEPEMRTRFKAIAVVNNQEVINMARLIAPFNGKPVLITESGTLMRGTRRPGAEGEGAPDSVARVESDSAGSNGGSSGSSSGGSSFGADEFLELDIHVRRWNFMARKGLSKLTPKFGLINVSVAFLVEGREDSELPEQILGCATVNCFDTTKAREVDA
ncbi:conserved unknown protein [Ectocarpus siliculosus]|uniref:Protein ENHANCED DISEASE RESISTANCE 2 C-terminal domain-containing protein n=1 Tax=Ectocarpus siliculosus TaxID=2880 RepID=D8LGE8_ECTSI|nr:conserved unknown protein [Ectocarpus siliculosus]|eukprot:CBN75723.1 conserved unknown protein [Ectocarpus siliculosus]